MGNSVHFYTFLLLLTINLLFRQLQIACGFVILSGACGFVILSGACGFVILSGACGSVILSGVFDLAS